MSDEEVGPDRRYAAEAARTGRLVCALEDWLESQRPTPLAAGSGWSPRTCDGCGRPVAARSPDPAVRVLCVSCHPDDLPFVPGGATS